MSPTPTEEEGFAPRTCRIGSTFSEFERAKLQERAKAELRSVSGTLRLIVLRELGLPLTRLEDSEED